MSDTRVCSYYTCERKYLCKGFCKRHYYRNSRKLDMDSGRRSLEQRLVAKIKKKENGCWLWTGAKSGGDGREAYKYGYIRIDGTGYRVHRVMYELSTNKKLGDLHVLHTCDTPLCVNPNHLKAGTHTDNMHDMIRKGRDFHPSMKPLL